MNRPMWLDFLYMLVGLAIPVIVPTIIAFALAVALGFQGWTLRLATYVGAVLLTAIEVLVFLVLINRQSR